MKIIKKIFALFCALISGWILFFIIDAPGFIDEFIALPIFILSMKTLGVDLTRYVPWIKARKKKSIFPSKNNQPSGRGPVIDV
jgi:hypothetical protein